MRWAAVWWVRQAGVCAVVALPAGSLQPAARLASRGGAAAMPFVLLKLLGTALQTKESRIHPPTAHLRAAVVAGQLIEGRLIAVDLQCNQSYAREGRRGERRHNQLARWRCIALSKEAEASAAHVGGALQLLSIPIAVAVQPSTRLPHSRSRSRCTGGWRAPSAPPSACGQSGRGPASWAASALGNGMQGHCK